MLKQGRKPPDKELKSTIQNEGEILMAKEKDNGFTRRELAVLRKRYPNYRGEFKSTGPSHVDSDPMSIMGEDLDNIGPEDRKRLDKGYRQDLTKVIAELAFAVNKAGTLEAFTALAEWMETQGHTPFEILVAFEGHLRPKRFSTPIDMPGCDSFNPSDEK